LSGTALALFALLGIGAGATAGPFKPGPKGPAATQLLFDDFSYDDQAGLSAHGWRVRSGLGPASVTAARWDGSNISFKDDPAQSGNRLLRLTASTDGTSKGSSQAELNQLRKFREGTYATRVRFADTPASGPDGDSVVAAFYAVSPLRAPLDPEYSELDFEYLPNGGWGRSGPTMFATSWETYRAAPRREVKATSESRGSVSGWHTLVLQVARGRLSYYVDGRRIASHGGQYYPEAPMALSYSLWFIPSGLTRRRASRRYEMDVDWALYSAGAVLSSREVGDLVERLRRESVRFRDTVTVPD
jgi:hypothetical protein